MPTINLKDAAERELVYRHLFFKSPGRGLMVPVRMKPDMIAAIDKWINDFYEATGGNNHPDGGNMMTRQEAVRWIIFEHLMLKNEQYD